jgi:hypothetical protein
MEQLISDYVNGNLAEAKRRARRYSLQKLVDGFLDYGHAFQAACDAEHAEKQSA